MRIEFNRFSDIGHIDFSDEADLTLLIGDNGAGKTFLLESYAKANDYLVNKFIESSYFIKLVKSFELEIVSSEKITEEIKHKYQSRLIKKYQIELQFDFDGLKKKFSSDLSKATSDLNRIIIEDVFFNEIEIEGLKLDVKDNIELSKDEQIFELKFEIAIDEIEEIEELEGTNNTETPKRPFSNITLKNVKNKNNLRMLKESEETKSIIDKVENKDFSDLENMIKFSISNLLKRKFIELNSLNNIIYIPSERVISMSATVERMLEKEKFNDLRYSEMKFMQQYSSAKEAITLLTNHSYNNIDYSPEYKELIGGKPVFNEDGEMVCIENERGQKINRSLFSTKQNKLSPFFILELKFDQFFYNKKRMRGGNLPSLVIVEEPEAHLSLKGVMQMANYIYHLARDRKVIVSTHSDILLSRINNIYVSSENKLSLNGYEILEKESLNIFKSIELTKLGLRSDFIENQLNFLFEETSSAQKSLDDNGEE